LAQKALELVPFWEAVHQQAFSLLAQAYQSFAATRMRSNWADLRSLVGGMPTMLTVRVQRRVLSGVSTFQVDTQPTAMRPRFGLLGSSAELDRTIMLLRDAADALARLAGLNATLRSLARVLRKTIRQVRVLRDRLIPTYRATIQSTQETLDEQERDYLFQLKRIC
jgi:V/A-type H+-transporting ATPase subunit D